MLADTRKSKYAKQKYPMMPASMAKGNVQFFINCNIDCALLFMAQK